MMKLWLVLSVTASVAACAAPNPAIRASSTPDPVAEEPQSADRVSAKFEAGEALIAASGFRGTFVWRTADSSRDRIAFPELAAKRFRPASTFKIPNTLIALETRVAPDVRFRLKWDGVKRSIDSWNRDHDLRSALEESVVWYYQEIARRIGAKRMSEWLARLSYGNAKMGDRVDIFWLAGPLAISAREQLEFVVGLTSGTLPFSRRSMWILRDIMPRREFGELVLAAKTGTYLDDAGCHGWLVGWVERRGHIAGHFALLLVGAPNQLDALREARWDLAANLAHEALGSGR